jgi:hypothetical protein
MMFHRSHEAKQPIEQIFSSGPASHVVLLDPSIHTAGEIVSQRRTGNSGEFSGLVDLPIRNETSVADVISG